MRRSAHPLRIAWALFRCQVRIAWTRLRDREVGERAQRKLDLWRAQQRDIAAARRAPTLREIEHRPAWIEVHPRRPRRRFALDLTHYVRARRIDALDDDDA